MRFAGERLLVGAILKSFLNRDLVGDTITRRLERPVDDDVKGGLGCALTALGRPTEARETSNPATCRCTWKWNLASIVRGLYAETAHRKPMNKAENTAS